MKPAPAISLKLRIAIVLALWLAAGLIPAIFSELMLEYDGPHTELYRRLDFIWFAPFCLPSGLAWGVLPGQWNGREYCEFLLSCIFFCAFIAHTGFTVTRKTIRAFVLSAFALAIILAVSALCDVRYWHWDYNHAHG